MWKAKPRKEERFVECPACGTVVTEETEKCPDCGEPLGRMDFGTLEKRTVMCIICGENVPADSESCPECGEALEKISTGRKKKEVVVKKEPKRKVSVFGFFKRK